MVFHCFSNYLNPASCGKVESLKGFSDRLYIYIYVFWNSGIAQQGPVRGAAL